ncbi:MAG: LptF/LptG family permease [Thermoflavifilum sp.]|uniref:LptF/LptG family permease n=1 Tax=Thermoflavifilum sp. TaxID=1968839 RepID=UPI0018A51EB7|nr:LptF/LptG family permease [Thermoflavifilum sp.]QOR76414.1 MAG: LptF/LptG family permease [Thermoflavifilum sp.]
MKKLDKLIIKAFLGPFVVTFFITLFVLIMQFLWKYIDDLVGKGLEMGIILKLLGYMSTQMVPLALPLAILLSSIMTFGNLGENFELVALKSAGISLMRFMQPLIILSGCIAILAFLFSNYVIPWANLHGDSLLYDIRNLKHGFNIKPGVFFNELEGYAIRVGDKAPDGKTIYHVVIYDRSVSTSDKLILAEKGIMEQSPNKRYVIFTLFNGWEYEERGFRPAVSNDFVRVHFHRFQKIFDLSSFAFTRTPIQLFAGSYQMLNVKQLNQAIDSIGLQLDDPGRRVKAEITPHYAFYAWKDTGWLAHAVPLPAHVHHFIETIPDSVLSYVLQRIQMNIEQDDNMVLQIAAQNYKDLSDSIRKHKIEWHRKFTLSFACMVLFLIGAPLGSIIRKGGLGTPLVFAVGFFVVYNVISTIGEKLARNGVVAPWLGMWLATMVLVPIAVFLVYKALNDSQLFNKEFYYRLGKQIRTSIRQFVRWMPLFKRFGLMNRNE